MALEQKWEKERNPLQPITNSDLICDKCKNKTKSVVSCEMYEVKPVSVLKGGVCYEFKKQ